MKMPLFPSRLLIGRAALLVAVLSIVWLLAGALQLVPLLLSLPGESSIRVHAAVTVACLLLAAWGYWNE